jgi:hypothetical protein
MKPEEPPVVPTPPEGGGDWPPDKSKEESTEQGGQTHKPDGDSCKTEGQTNDLNQRLTPDDKEKTKEKTKDGKEADPKMYRLDKVGQSIGTASDSTIINKLTIKGGHIWEEEKGLFELVISLPPRNSRIPRIFPDELDGNINELREKRLILISCTDEAVAFAAAYAIFDKLELDDQHKYMLKFDSKGIGNSALTINLFYEERKDSKAETVFLVDASSDSTKSFLDSLLPFGNSLWINQGLSQNSYLIVCIVNPAEIKNSLKKLGFPQWNLDFLKQLLKYHFPDHAGLEERILSQRKRGKWNKDDITFCEEIDTLIRNNQLLEQIDLLEQADSSEQAPETIRAESLFAGNDPIADTAMYVATFFPKFSPQDFKQVVKSLLGERTMTVSETVYKQTGNGAAEPVEVQKEVSLCKIWQENADKILKRCQLEAVSSRDSIRTISFSDPALKEKVKEYFELERSLFLEDQFENVQSQGLLFHQSAKVNESVTRLIAEQAASYPGNFDGDLLIGIIKKLTQTDQSAGALEAPELQFITRMQGDRQGWVYTRISELLRRMLEYPALKDTPDDFLRRLISLKLHDSVLNIVKRLQFAPEFDLLHWLKQLLDQGSEDAQLRTYLFLYGYVKKTGPAIYETLGALERWLPSADRDAKSYSRSNHYALRLLMEHCWETALSYNPNYHGSQPCLYPLFAIKDSNTAKDNFKLLSRWLFHPGMPSIWEDDTDFLTSIIIAQWVFILAGPTEKAVASGKSTDIKINIISDDAQVEDGSTADVDNGLLLSLLLREIAAVIEKPQLEEIQMYWEGLIHIMSDSITKLPYRGNHRELAIRRRNLIKDVARQFKGLVREVKSVKRRQVNV